MARIVGINLPEEKRIVIALTYIYGIGKETSESILDEVGIGHSVRTKDLSESDINKLQEVISRIATEGDLRRKLSLDIKRLQEIGSYRGYRHRRKLPVRGQRTRCNCRTRKGHKRVAIAGKKKVAK